jgi:AraC-like DNA-binding protein
MESPDWRIASGDGETRLAPGGVTAGSGPGWRGRFERMTFGPGFHMHLGRIDVSQDAEHHVRGADDAPAAISIWSVAVGRCTVAMDDWPEFALRAGQAILFTPRGRRAVFRLPAPQTFRFFSVAMDPELLASLLDDGVPAALAALFESHGRDTVVHEHMVSHAARALIEGLGDPAEAGALERLHREAVALQLLTETLGASLADPDEPQPLPPREAAAVHAARKVLLSDLREAPSAAALAERAGMGLRRFLRSFEALHGASPAQLLRRERLARARQLLETGEASLKEIAWQVGYHHVSNFVTAFAEEFGAPPRRFQRRSLAAE